jgi:hypothetical protein
MSGTVAHHTFLFSLCQLACLGTEDSTGRVPNTPAFRSARIHHACPHALCEAVQGALRIMHTEHACRSECS